MGNTCEPDATSPAVQQNLNLPGSRLRTQKSISNMPRSSYAYQVNQPDLNPNISATLNDLMYRSSFKNQNQQFPFFYIISKKAFYQGGFNTQRLPQGSGIAIFEDGTYYQGKFINGQAQDQKGLIIFPNGGYYLGNIKNSTMNGKGKFTHRNVYSYDGEWENGAPNGNGVETYEDDKIKYQGSFVSGFKEGKGEYSWEDNNNKYIGKFQNGLMNDDKGTIQSKGSKFTGNFIDGRRQGYGVVTTNNGALEGDFVNDEINGKGKFLWQDGKVYEGQFKKSQFHGPGKIIYPNKKIVEGQWRQNHNLMVSKIV